MKIYVAYCHDRHIDPVIRVFSNRDKAVEFAREFMDEHMARPSLVKTETVDCYVLWLQYEPESDHAYVIETTLDDDSQ